jgi:hypothetical protein
MYALMIIQFLLNINFSTLFENWCFGLFSYIDIGIATITYKLVQYILVDFG